MEWADTPIMKKKKQSNDKGKGQVSLQSPRAFMRGQASQSEIHPLHKPTVYATGISPLQGAGATWSVTCYGKP